MANALETLFTETANSIRGGLPDVGKMSPSVFPEKIDEIVANGKNPALQEKTVTPTTSQQEVTPDAEYDGLSKVTVEAMQVSNTASPVIEVSDAGLIQASVQYSEGYITEDTRKTAVKQLPIKAGERVIPSTTDKVAIEAGVFTTWPVTVAGDANLVPENIKSGTSIFGVDGTHEGGIDVTLIEGMEIALDFSAGDQSIAAPEGYAVKSAIIKKPTNLKPEYISKDVNVAGVVGTLESGGGGVSAGGLELVYFDTQYATATQTNCSFAVDIPKDATNIFFASDTFKVSGYLPSYGVTSNFATIPGKTAFLDEEPYVDLGNGYKRITVISQTYSASSSYTNITARVPFLLRYTVPNVTFQNNNLCATSNCEGIFFDYSSAIRRSCSYFVETIDLRGSKVKQFAGCTYMEELKKVWLSEMTTDLLSPCFYGCAGLEELHFTSTTPPTTDSNYTFAEMATTCKIYVPAGSLSAYTSAANYPSASTYTYIEE